MGRARLLPALALLLAACAAPPPPAPPPEAETLQPCDLGLTWTYRVRTRYGTTHETQTLLAVEKRHFPEWDRTLDTPNLYVSEEEGIHLDKGFLPRVDGVLHVSREAWLRGAWTSFPPMPLFGGAAGIPGTRWEWTGKLVLRCTDREYEGPSTAVGAVEEWEDLEVPLGRFPCLRSRVVHQDGVLEILRWHAPGVGLVKETWAAGGKVFLVAELEARGLP